MGTPAMPILFDQADGFTVRRRKNDCSPCLRFGPSVGRLVSRKLVSGLNFKGMSGVRRPGFAN